MTEAYPLLSELVSINNKLGIEGKILWTGRILPPEKKNVFKRIRE